MVRRTAYLLVILAAACGSVPSDPPDGGGGGGPDAGGPGIDAAGEEWTREHVEPVSLGDWYHVVGHDDRIYFSRDHTDGTQFFKSYQAGSGQVLDEMSQADPENDLCGCGLTSDLVAWTAALFYFANYGHYFDLGTRMWQPAPYPLANQRGEAAVAVLDDQILFVGGRGPMITSQMLDIPTGVWFTDTPPSYVQAVDSARGVAHGGRMYVLGGYDVAGAIGVVASWGPGDPGWTVHPELPEIGVQNVVAYHGQLWAQYGARVHIFDVASNQWLANQVNVPITERAVPVVVTVGGEEALYFVEAGQLETRFLRYNR